MATKITKKMMFNAILEVLKGEQAKYSVEDMQAFIDKEIALLDRKSNSKKAKLTKAQEQNEFYKELILEVMESAGKPLTATEILKSKNEFSNFTNQKITVLLKLLRNEGKVSRIVEKSKPYFVLGSEVENESESE